MPYDIIIGRNRSDKELFGKRGLIYIGKGYVKMGNYVSLSNKIFLDVVRSHVILIAGKRGSGKSYTLGVIAEELSQLPKEVRRNIAPLIFDTMGIFWTMKYPNERDLSLLEEWGLKPKKLPINLWMPGGYLEEYEKRGLPVDNLFFLKPSDLEIEDWLSIFELEMTSLVSILIQKTIFELKDKKEEFYLEDIIKKIMSDKSASEETKKKAVALFNAAESWKIFSKKGEKSTSINDLVEAGKSNVLDLSVYSSVSSFDIRGLIIGLISKKLFTKRILIRKKEEISEIHFSFEEKKEMPLIWLMIDEAHEFLPADRKTPATAPLIQILREGRQPGISLVLATQQPGVIHRDVMTQSDLLIAHRLTNKKDLEALNEIMQTYLLEGIKKSMRELPDLRGSAIILDDNSERLYSIRIRPRLTWHGGEAPRAIKKEKEF